MNKMTKRARGHPKQEGIAVMIQIRLPSAEYHTMILNNLTAAQRGLALITAANKAKEQSN